MIAIDTNHLIRHVLGDESEQCAQVCLLIESAKSSDQQIHLLDLVLVEACWVLQRGMGFGTGRLVPGS